MKRITTLVLAFFASTAVGASVQIPQRNASGGGYDFKGSDGTKTPCTGCIGEKITGTIQNSGASFSSGSVMNTYQIVLTPGVWMMVGHQYFNSSSAVPSGSNSRASIATTSGALDSTNIVLVPSNTNTDTTVTVGPLFVQTTVSATYFMNAAATFASGAVNNFASGTNLYAVRIY